MGYGLGVDLGTTYTAAAVNVGGRVDAVRLGSHRPEIPSVVFLRPDGGVLVGEAAERRGQGQPGRLAREFKRRLGDPVPVMVGGAPFSAHALTARLLSHVVETVTRLQEAAPDRIVVAHPANWGPYKRELLAQAAQLANITDVVLRPEPEAAAVRYAGTARVSTDDIVAVYDLGGGTFDAAVLRKSPGGFTLLGEPEGIEQLGGIDFDEAVLEHVRSTLGEALADLDQEDAETTEALARLRRDCVEAKETLSEDTEAVVAVALPHLHTRVRINRSQFEAMIAPALNDTVAAVRRALRSAGVRPAQLRSIVLAGGSSRIPLVGELLSTAFERPVVLDDNPELGIALGAATLSAPPAAAAAAPRQPVAQPRPAAEGATATTGTPPAPVAPTVFATGKAGPVIARTSAAPATGSPARPAPPDGPRQTAGPVIGRASLPAAQPPAAHDDDGLFARVAGLRWRRYRWPLVGAVVAALIAVTAAAAWPRGGSGGPGPVASSAPALTEAWRAVTGQPATGAPLVTADRVFVGGEDGMIRALRRSDGRPDWSFPAGPGAIRLGRVIDDKVYGASADGVLWAVDARTGKQRWRQRTGGTFAAAPAVYATNVYIGGLDNVLYAYSRDGKRRWRGWPGGEIRMSPVAVADVVVVATRDRVLYGVDRSTTVWKRTVGQVVDNPTANGEAVCVAVDDGSVRCLSGVDGEPRSRIAVPGIRLSAPVAGEGVVYAAASDGTVGAWDSDTGTQRWLFRPEHGPAAPARPAMRDRFLYLAYPDGRLTGIDADTGARRWEFTLDDRLTTAPRVDGGFLFVTGATGTVHAVRLPPGEAETSTTTAPSRSPSPAAETTPASGTTRRGPRTTPPRTSQRSPDPSNPTITSTPATGETTTPSLPPWDDGKPLLDPSR